MRPLIGVTGPDHGGWPAWIATEIAILRAGGRAVRITPSRPRSLDGLHGLIIGGGADVDPKLYNEDRVVPELRKQLRREVKRRWQRRETWALIGFSPEDGFKPSVSCQLSAAWKLLGYRLGMIVDLALLTLLWTIRHLLSLSWSESLQEHRNRDELEVPLVREAIARGLPVFGICRGMQLINVCLGGSLYQEISVFYEESPILTTLLPRKRVHVQTSSHLRKVLGRISVRVNSLHYQAVKTLGRGLKCVALEPNGVIQAIEYAAEPGDASPYILGVQWHPEYLPLEASQQRLFRSVVDAARIAADRPDTIAAAAVCPPATDTDTLAALASSRAVSGASRSS